MDVKNIELDEEMAHIIMGGLAISYTEGIYGIDFEHGPTNDQARAAEKRVIRAINKEFPHVVDNYSYISAVQKVREKLAKEAKEAKEARK